MRPPPPPPSPQQQLQALMVIIPSPCKQQKNTPDYSPPPSDVSPSIAVLVGRDTNRLELNA